MAVAVSFLGHGTTNYCISSAIRLSLAHFSSPLVAGSLVGPFLHVSPATHGPSCTLRHASGGPPPSVRGALAAFCCIWRPYFLSIFCCFSLLDFCNVTVADALSFSNLYFLAVVLVVGLSHSNIDQCWLPHFAAAGPSLSSQVRTRSLGILPYLRSFVYTSPASEILFAKALSRLFLRNS